MKVMSTLSRAAFQDNSPEISDKEMNYFVHFMMSSLPIGEKSDQKLVTETAKNDTLWKLRHQNSAGWLEHCLRPYHHHNSEVTYQDGLVLKGQQIIVPSSLQLEICKILYQGHLGIEKTKSRARQSLFWSNMNTEIQYQIVRHTNNTKAVKVLNHSRIMRSWTNLGQKLVWTCSKYRGDTPSILKSANSSIPDQ